MPLGSAINSVRLLVSNINTQKPTMLPIKHRKPDKPVIFSNDEKIDFLPRSTPEEHGYSREYIESFFNEIESDLSLRINRLLIIKDDAVIAEKYIHPYVKETWDCIFSASKTVVALALGVLYDRGLIDLDEPVYKTLRISSPTNLNNKKITLRHLLTMSSGNAFNEMESAAAYKWVRGYFDTKSKFKVGSKFEYNSLNSYIISVVVEKKAGMTFEKFVRETIFDLLHIGSAHFDTSPEGYFKGGWGLYILPEDMAKLGILVRDFGLFNNQRIISEEWIKMMTSKQFDAKKFGRTYDYGYQIWVDEEKDYCCFNGMYDQDIMIYRKSGVVVVTCAANNEAFHGSNQYKIVDKYFLNEGMGDFPLCNNKGNRDIKNLDNLMYYYEGIANKEYKPQGKIANSCGVLPVILQNELGTYAKGIKSLTFKLVDGNYSFLVKEGTHEFDIKFDFDKGIRQTLNIFGNLFDCSADARFILSGKGDPYLIIRLFFLEFSSSRYFSVKIGKSLEELSIEESENPGFEFVNSILEVQDESTKNTVNNFMKIINPDLLTGKIRNIFAPIYTVKTK